MSIRIIHFVWLSAIIVLSLFTNSCAKEFSYERRSDSTVTVDSSVHALQLPVCSVCNGGDVFAMSKWSFKYGSTLTCGKIDTAILTPDKDAFTSFGPSACSSDTGLVITAYLDGTRLDQDRLNYTTDHVAFYYYDHVGPSYIFIVRPPLKFSLTIDSYIKQTGVVQGRFSGSAFLENNELGTIASGKFSLVLK